MNSMNCIKFIINNNLLYYLKRERIYFIKNSKSKKKLENIISLKIANINSNILFHLNINVNWRKYLYTISFFIFYQESKWSLLLLIFYNKKILTNIDKKMLYI